MADAGTDAARQRIATVARWSEEAGCEGMLVFTDNRQLDPWLVAQCVIECTQRLVPLVAVQPIYMHPYSVAKMVSSLALLHGRRVDLNMVAGGFKNDLAALDDKTPHDERYARLVDYTRLIQKLLASSDAVTHNGHYYRARQLQLIPPLAPQLVPHYYVSGSSSAGQDAAHQLLAVAVEYPKPTTESGRAASIGARGMRIGIITRADGDEAWRVARERFPEDRQGQLTHQLAMKVSDSQWHRQLSELGRRDAGENDPYWLVPFENYKAICPYLVGSHDRVALELRRYIDAGYASFILDEPESEEDLAQVSSAFLRAAELRIAA